METHANIYVSRKQGRLTNLWRVCLDNVKFVHTSPVNKNYQFTISETNLVFVDVFQSSRRTVTFPLICCHRQ